MSADTLPAPIKCLSCDSDMSADDTETGYTTCEACRNAGLTITDYGLEPVENES